MPVETIFTDDGRGILLTGKSIVEGHELLSIKEGFLREPDRLKEIDYWLVDFSEVRELRMSIDDLSQLIEIERQLALTIPNSMVTVAASADSVYGFARMWEMKIEKVGWTTSVFRDVQDAKAWVESRLSFVALSRRAGSL
jgi:hypothetical protein